MCPLPLHVSFSRVLVRNLVYRGALALILDPSLYTLTYLAKLRQLSISEVVQWSVHEQSGRGSIATFCGQFTCASCALNPPLMLTVMSNG